MRYFTLLLTISCVQQAFAQNIFRDVTAVQFGDSIMLNWTLTAGNTCFDMHLQRSDNDAPFMNVFSVGGVCGGADDQYYAFVDNEQLSSGTLYAYRITASNDTYASDTVTITFIDAGEKDIFLYPNPGYADVQVTIDNKYTPTFLYEIFDSNGNQIDIGQHSSNLFTLSTDGYTPGVYVLKITTRDGVRFATSLIVL